MMTLVSTSTYRYGVTENSLISHFFFYFVFDCARGICM